VYTLSTFHSHFVHFHTALPFHFTLNTHFVHFQHFHTHLVYTFLHSLSTLSPHFHSPCTSLYPQCTLYPFTLVYTLNTYVHFCSHFVHFHSPQVYTYHIHFFTFIQVYSIPFHSSLPSVYTLNTYVHFVQLVNIPLRLPTNAATSKCSSQSNRPSRKLHKEKKRESSTMLNKSLEQRA